MVFAFGDCEVDLKRYELRCASTVYPLEPKAFNVLAYLIEHRTRVVLKEELLEKFWPGEFVTESALARCLKVIRQAVNDDGVRQHVIKTLRGRGYRFVAAVEVHPAPPVDATAPAALGSKMPSSLEHDAAASSLSASPHDQLSHSVQPVATPPVRTVESHCCRCQTANRTTRQFCAACGQALWSLCPHCGFGNGLAERFCGGCGRDVEMIVPLPAGARTGPPLAYTPSTLAAKMLTDGQTLAGERKPVTVLVVGIQGLRALTLRCNSEDVDEVLDRGFALLVAEVHQVEGFVTQVAGHDFTALFGVPLAYEDHVLRALHAALKIRQAFTDYAIEVQRVHGVNLTLHLGVHTGPVVIGTISQNLQLTYTAQGVTFQLAADLQRVAEAGTIYVSEAVQQQAAGFFRFDDYGLHVLPDLAESVRVYACKEIGPTASRLERSLTRGWSAFQGRVQEQVLLEALWSRVCRGEGQVACLVGEAGIGKSRLAYEFQRILTEACLLTIQPLSYGRTMPHHAVIPLLRTLLGVVKTESPTQQLQQIKARLATIDPTLVADAPLLANLLGVMLEAELLPPLAPEARKRHLQHACLQVLVQQSANTPLCLLVEDLHWLDPSTQELLDLLVLTLARRPILLLGTARPGFRHPWMHYTYFHQLAIEPLSADETYALIHDVLQPYNASASLCALVYAQSGGNPLFVEELLRTLQTHNLFTLHGDVCEMSADTRPALPTSIQEIVQARLDRLPAEEKWLLQIAAMIGPEVEFPLLHALSEYSEEALYRALTHLQIAEFLYETPASWVSTYTFKHILIQEATYQSVPKHIRQQSHQWIAQVVETRFPETAETQPELLAYHYTEAGLHEQAIAYWQRAGKRAIERSAYAEAITHLIQGLELLKTQPDTHIHIQQELSLQLMLGLAYTATKGFAAPEVVYAFSKARELCLQIESSPQLLQVLRGLLTFHLVRAELQTAFELGEQLLSLAQSVQDLMHSLIAHRTLGVVSFCAGELVTARTHLEQGLILHDPQQPLSLAFCYGDDEADHRVLCLSYATTNLGSLGYLDQALESIYEAIALAREASHPLSLAYALAYAAVLHQYRGEVQAVQERAEAAVALSTEQGFPFFLAHGTILQGWTRIRQGQREDGIAQICQGLDIYRATGAELYQPYYLTLLAEAYEEGSQHEAALGTLNEAMSIVDRTGERYCEAEMYRLKGKYLLMQSSNNQSEAETCFRQALEIAKKQSAKFWELRAATSLARLWQSQGKRDEARELLSGVYGWFTEGFDTADLKDAKALLDELS